MTSKRYLGNIITDTPTEPTENYANSAASGVWSLAEAERYTAAGLWPTAGNVQAIRGLFAGGEWSGGSSVNIIDYITITSTGNATDFGDLDQARYGSGGFSSATRGVFAGGYASSDVNKIQYVTIASTGNASDFGDLTSAKQHLGGASNGTNAVYAGGNDNNGAINNIDKIVIATTGNATDFGDMTRSAFAFGSCSGNAS